ncbi:MAG: tetratricopeptide repeat protein [Chloroflexi bacterium]|nr:tetratricopeptide repeat protein [Chloroflexota bacterium]
MPETPSCVISEIKQILPDSTWNWVIPALMKEPLVWDSLCILKKDDPNFPIKNFIRRPEDCTPAAIALSLLKYPSTPDQLRSLPLMPVEDNFRDAVESISEENISDLCQAGLLALKLREIYRKNGIWEHSINQIPSAALCCLFGIIPDQLALLKKLINGQENRDENAENQSIQLALHVLLSNPLPLDSMTELTNLFLKELPLSLQQQIVRALVDQNAQLGTRIAQSFVKRYETPAYKKPVSLLDYVKELNHKVECAEFFRLAADSYKGNSLLEQVKNEINRFQANLNLEMAKNTALNGDSEKAIGFLEQAVKLDSTSLEYFGAYLMALIDQNKYEEAQQNLIEYSHSIELIDHPGILLAEALIELNSPENSPIDQMMKARDICLKIIYYLRDAPTSDDYSFCDIAFVTRLIKCLLRVNLAQEAAWVAAKYIFPISTNPSLQHLLAQTKFAAADIESAVQAAHLAVAVEPSNTTYCRTLAECLEANRDWQNAALERKRIIEQSASPRSQDFHALGFCAIRAGLLDIGIKACQQALSLNGNDGIAYAIMGELVSQNSNASEASEYFDRAIQFSSNYIYPWKALAEFSFKSGSLEKALETLKTASHITPDAPEIYMLLGDMYQKTDSPTLALEAYKQAASLIGDSIQYIDPDEEKFFASVKAIDLACRISEKLGAMLCELGHIEESQAVLEKALSNYPFDPNLAYQLSRTYIAQHEYAAAFSALQTVLASKPGNAQPYLDYARCAIALNENGYHSILFDFEKKNYRTPEKSGELIAVLQKALQIDPSLEEAKALLAEILAFEGDYAMAMDAFRAALETGLAKEKTWQSRLGLGLGVVALKLNQGETAVAALLEANKTDPSNPLIHQALSMAYQSLGLNEDSLNSARAALMIDSGNVDLLAWFAKQITSLKDHQGEMLPHVRSEAIAALRRAVNICPQRADLWIFLGQIQLSAGDLNGAAESLSKLIPVQNQEYTLDSLPAELYLAGKYLLDLNLPVGACTCLEMALHKKDELCNLARNRLVSSNPSQLDMYSLLARCRKQTGAIQSALEAVNEAISLAPDNENLYLDKIDLILEMYAGSLSRSEQEEGISTLIESFETALKLNSENPDIYYKYALVLRMIGQLSTAQSLAEKASELYRRRQSILSNTPQFDGDQFKVNELSARILAAELARARLAYESAHRILETEFRTDVLLGNSNPKENLTGVMGALPVEYSCLHAELALAEDDPSTAASDLENISQSSLSRPRALALQARLALRRGDIDAASNMLQGALAEIGSLQNNTPPLWTQISSLDDIAAAFKKIALYQAVAEAALELHQWESGIYLLHEVAYVASHEPQSHIGLARAIVLRAEFQNLCREAEVVSHAPGIAALSDISHKTFADAIQSALSTLNGEEKEPWSNETLERWKIRGNAIFEADHKIAEAFSQRNAKPDDIAAQIAALRYMDNISEAGHIGRLHAHHPLVLIQLALTLKNENPRQALAAAYSAHEAAHKSMKNSKPEQSGNLSPQVLLITPIIDYLLASLAFNVGNRNGDFTTAIKSIEDAIAEWDNEPYWHLLAANILQATKIPDTINTTQNALSHLLKAAELDPKNGNLFLSIGNIFLKQKDIPQAINAFEQACQVLPDLADAWLLLAKCYDSAGNLPEAKRCVDQAISLDPTQPPSLLLRAQIAMKNKDYIAAERLANTVLQFEPENTTAILLLSRALSQLNKTEEGLVILEKALSNFSDNAPLRLERVRLLQQLNKFNLAISELKDLTQHYPDDPAILSVFAEVLEETGEKFEAIKTAQRALRLGHERAQTESFEEHIGLHILLGKLFHQTGQLDQAIQHLNEAIQINPGNMEAYLELAQTYKERRENGQALNMFQEAMKTAPDDHRPYYLAGLLLKETKDYLGAEKMLRKAAKLAPKELPIQRQLGALVALNLVHNRSAANTL